MWNLEYLADKTSNSEKITVLGLLFNITDCPFAFLVDLAAKATHAALLEASVGFSLNGFSHIYFESSRFPRRDQRKCVHMYSLRRVYLLILLFRFDRGIC